MKKQLCIAFFIFSCLYACSTTEIIVSEDSKTSPVATSELENIIQENISEFGVPIVPESENEIFALSEQQSKDFLAFYNAPENAEDEGHMRLYKYLLNFGDNFSYSDYTNTAQETELTASGNCMSLAVLTTAYARLVNLRVKYQVVKRVPIYQKFGSVIFNAQHVRTIVSEPAETSEKGEMIIPAYSIIDYYPSRYSIAKGYISQDEFLGRYYRNLAAEALGENDNLESYWLAKHSLSKDIDNEDAINSLAVVNRRVGQTGIAEDLYQYGLENAENKVGLLKNYRILLKLQGRTAEAELLSKQLENYTDRNPFDMLQEAEQVFQQGQFTQALRLYVEIISFAPYLHQAYFGIAKSEYQRGNVIAANQALKRALKETYNPATKSVYAAKLAALKKSNN